MKEKSSSVKDVGVAQLEKSVGCDRLKLAALRNGCHCGPVPA